MMRRTHANVNPRFLHSSFLAIRVAFACACAIPATWMLPEDWDVYTNCLPNVIPAVVLTINMNVSTTVLHALKSLVGVSLAVGNAGLLSLCPNGEVHIALLNFAVFSLLILVLNLHIKTKVLAMSLTPIFVMKYANPDVDINFHRNFRDELEAMLFFQFLGVVLAVLSVLLPHPLLAYTALRHHGAHVAQETAEFLSEVSRYQVGTEQNMQIHLLKCRVERWKATMEHMAALTDEAWWEGFDVFGLGPFRAANKRFCSVLQTQEKTLEVLNESAVKEEFSGLHSAAMRPMKRVLLDFSAATADLIHATACATCDLKRATADAKKQLDPYADNVARVQQSLIDQWTISRQQNAHSGLGLHKDLRMENFFICQLSNMATHLVDLARGEAARAGEKTRVVIGIQDFMDIFDWKVLSDSNHLNFVLRNFLSLNLAFSSGLFFYHYDGGMAVFVALMMSTTPGAALTKNLGRMQGTVLGMLVGNVLYMFLSMHSGWAWQCIAIFLFEMVTLFIYFYSETYAHIGCLLAIFGGKVLIQPCSQNFTDKDKLMRDAMAYHSFYMLAMALGIITAVDLIFFSQPASAMAREALVKAMDSALQQFSDFMSQGEVLADGVLNSAEETSAAILASLSKAKVLCAEAEQEPRWHKAPFKSTLVTLLIEKLTILNSHLQVLQASFHGRGADDLWGVVSSKPGFKRVKDVLLESSRHTQTLVRAVLEHESCEALELDAVGDAEKTSKGGLLKDLEHLPRDIEDLVNECRPDLAERVKEQKAPEKAEFDLACNLCAIFSMLEEVTSDLMDIIICTAKRM